MNLQGCKPQHLENNWTLVLGTVAGQRSLRICMARSGVSLTKLGKVQKGGEFGY